jgi:non-ribosomal peptide synthetase-like protein
VQTGANFGLDQRHDDPFLCEVGRGTMVSDGLTMINLVMSNSAFKLNRVHIGEHNYLGNNIHYPAGAKTGANCLLGTKVMIPIEGPVRENVGLLGSPCFEIPRAVDRDMHLKTMWDADKLQQRIRAKNRHNVTTMAAFVAANWLFFFLTVLCGFLALAWYPHYGALSAFAFAIAATLFSSLWFSALERASIGFKRLTPKLVSMYEPYFWSHERHWKFCGHPLMLLFGGTPLKNVLSRLMGVRMGRKVFDDGCRFYDKTLIRVGDYSNLNTGCVIQGHSLEEGIFKSDYIDIGAGCSLGPGAFVHYGVKMGDGVVLAPDSFLMKGEILDPESVWCGNPAKMIRHGNRGAATGLPRLNEAAA